MMTHRRKTLMALIPLALALAMRSAGPASAAPARQAEPEPITFGETVTAMLSAEAPEARFTFTAQQGDVVTISLTAVSDGVDPQLDLLDSTGAVVAQNDDIDFPNNVNAQIADFAIPAAGAYTIVVRVFGDVYGDCELSLTAGGDVVSSAGPSLPTLSDASAQAGGALRITLAWTGPVDLDLAVTDPDGNTISWQAITSPTGGVLDSSRGNDFCAALSEQPQEVIAWEAGAPAGAYQVQVQFSLACDAAEVAPFTVMVESAGEVVETFEGEVAQGDSNPTFAFDLAGQAGAPTQPAAAPPVLRFAVSWSGPADIDLAVTDPNGDRISWEAPTSPGGGVRDASRGNDFCVALSEQPQEIITWEANAPIGDYDILASIGQPCDAPLPLTLTITIEENGQVVATDQFEIQEIGQYYQGVYTYTGGLEAATEATPTAPASTETASATPTQTSSPPAVEPTPTEAAATAPATTGQGALEFVLRWTIAADLDLAVTDPNGNTINWQATESPTGGTLDSSQGNDFCTTLSEQPQETIAWEADAPAGNYSLQVTHSLPCETSGAVPFILDVLVDGEVVTTYEDEVSEGQSLNDTFSFAGSGAPGSGATTVQGFGPIPTFSDGSEVPLIQIGATYEGTVSQETYSVSGRIAGDAGATITVTVSRTSGDLLPVAAVLIEERDGSWTVLAATESQKGEPAVVTLTLPETRWYIVSASRVGVDEGMTTGDFELEIAGE